MSTSRTISYLNCLHPRENAVKCQGSIYEVKGLYHEVRQNMEAKNPDLLVAFNAGIAEEVHYKNWVQTLEMIKQGVPTPFLITGFNFKEVREDVKRLKMLGFQEQVAPQSNPFRSLRPFLDPAREESDFIFGNSSYSIVV